MYTAGGESPRRGPLLRRYVLQIEPEVFSTTTIVNSLPLRMRVFTRLMFEG